MPEGLQRSWPQVRCAGGALPSCHRRPPSMVPALRLATAGAGGACAPGAAPRPQAQQRGELFSTAVAYQTDMLPASWLPLSPPRPHGLILTPPSCPTRGPRPTPQFIDSTGTAKIADFGLARILSPAAMVSLTGETGSYLWMAPEVIRRAGQGLGRGSLGLKLQRRVPVRQVSAG